MGNLCANPQIRPHQIIITLGSEPEPKRSLIQSPVKRVCARKTYQNESQTKIYDTENDFLNITVQNNHPLLKNEN